MRKLSFLMLALSAAIPCHAALSLVNQATMFRSIAVVQPPTEQSRLFVIEHRSDTTLLKGRVRILNGTTIEGTFIEMSPLAMGGEQGLLGLAFHPNFASNRKFYVYSIATNWDSVITEFQTVAGNPYLADMSTANEIFRIPQPYDNHNGGTIRFGPDGYLWIGLGDGGAGNDPGNRAQNKTTLYGKMLRIDVNGDDFPTDPLMDYRIPADNPFAGPTAGADEVYHFGLRNPWQWDFDRRDHNGFGGLLIADVGQDNYEEVDYVLPEEKGVNFGWRTYEGFHLTGLTGGAGAPYRSPIYEYTHADGCSIGGGIVCRDPKLGLSNWGRYFFTDYCGQWLWGLDLQFDLETGQVTNSPIASAVVTGLTPGGGSCAVNSANNRKIYITRAISSRVWGLTETAPSRQVSGTLTFTDVVGLPPKGVLFEYLDGSGNVVASLQAGIPPNGAFTVPAPTGNYTLSVKSGTWLRKSVPANTTSADVSGLVFILVNGDVDDDNEVGPGDFSNLTSAFGAMPGDGNWNARADLDRDGEVGPSDFSILSSNFGVSGD